MSETIGAALKAAREQRRLTLAQVSESTKVRSYYLQALENDDISAMPSAAQARGFLRLYADFLGLDLEKLIPPPVAASSEPGARVAASSLVRQKFARSLASSNGPLSRQLQSFHQGTRV